VHRTLALDSDADVSLADAARQVVGASTSAVRSRRAPDSRPHAWLRQLRLEQAMHAAARTVRRRDGRCCAWLRLADCLRRCVQAVNRRYSDDGGAACVSSNRSASPPMALGQGTPRFARSTLCPCDHTEKEEWPGKSPSISLQTPRAGSPRDLRLCPRFTRRPLVDGDRRRIKPLERLCSSPIRWRR